MSDEVVEECDVAKKVAFGVNSVLPDVTDSLRWDEIHGVRIGDEVEVRIVHSDFKGGYAGYRAPLSKNASEDEVRAAEKRIVDAICADTSEPDDVF